MINKTLHLTLPHKLLGSSKLICISVVVLNFFLFSSLDISKLFNRCGTDRQGHTITFLEGTGWGGGGVWGVGHAKAGPRIVLTSIKTRPG